MQHAVCIAIDLQTTACHFLSFLHPGHSILVCRIGVTLNCCVFCTCLRLIWECRALRWLTVLTRSHNAILLPVSGGPHICGDCLPCEFLLGGGGCVKRLFEALAGPGKHLKACMADQRESMFAGLKIRGRTCLLQKGAVGWCKVEQCWRHHAWISGHLSFGTFASRFFGILDPNPEKRPKMKNGA